MNLFIKQLLGWKQPSKKLPKLKWITFILKEDLSQGWGIFSNGYFIIDDSVIEKTHYLPSEVILWKYA